MTTTPTSPMVLHYSRPKAIFKIGLGALCMGVVAYYSFFLVAGFSSSTAATLKGFGLLCLPYTLIYLWVAGSSIKALMWRGPVLTLDEDGITDQRRGDRLIPWQDIVGVHLGQDGNKACLVLKFRSLSVARMHMGGWRVPAALMNRILHFGEWYVVLGPLQYRGLAVLRKAERFLAETHGNA